MSEPQSTPSQSYPTQPRSHVTKYLAAIVVLIILFIAASGTAVYYYNQRGQSVNNAADLNTQIAGLNAQISSDRSQITSLNSRIDTLNQRISQLEAQVQCTPDSTYFSCSVEISSLKSQVTDLQNQKAVLQATVNDLTTQRDNLSDIVNMKKKTTVANSITVNWSDCGGSGQPSCTNQSPYILPSGFMSFCTFPCYAGLLNVTWTSTQHLTLSFTFYSSTSGTSTTSTPSESSGYFIIPIAGVFNSKGFHNDSCSTDLFGNIHCSGGTLTYSESYVY